MDDLGVACGELTKLLKMAIESSLIYLLKIVIFHSFVSLPEGNSH